MHLSRRLLSASIMRLADVVFPPVCAYCDCDLTPSEDVGAVRRLCEVCAPKLLEPPNHCCPKCAARVAATFQEAECPWCREHGLRFDHAYALGNYADDLREAIIRLKHPNEDALSTALAETLCERYLAVWQDAGFDIVVPVPMHWWRRVRQGHNGPELTAASVARRLAIRDYPRLLKRRRLTKPQAGLSHPQRQDNVRNAFAVRAGYRVDGARVLLNDDILTSGATCSEAARTLKRAGAQRVDVAIFGRAQREGG